MIKYFMGKVNIFLFKNQGFAFEIFTKFRGRTILFTCIPPILPKYLRRHGESMRKERWLRSALRGVSRGALTLRLSIFRHMP